LENREKEMGEKILSYRDLEVWFLAGADIQPAGADMYVCHY